MRINDASYGFGSVSSNVLTADPRTYGRCVCLLRSPTRTHRDVLVMLQRLYRDEWKVGLVWAALGQDVDADSFRTPRGIFYGDKS